MELIAFFLRGLRRLVFGTLARLFCALSRLRGEIGPLAEASSLAEPARPISGTQLRKLAKWLALHQPRRGSLGDIHALDGYLTGIVAGPQAVMPGTWIHDLFPGAVPRDIDSYLQLIAQHMKGIADQCIQRPPGYRCPVHIQNCPINEHSLEFFAAAPGRAPGQRRFFSPFDLLSCPHARRTSPMPRRSFFMIIQPGMRAVSVAKACAASDLRELVAYLLGDFLPLDERIPLLCGHA